MSQAMGRKLTVGSFVAVCVLGAAMHDASAQGKPATAATSTAKPATTTAPPTTAAAAGSKPTTPATPATASGPAKDAKEAKARYQGGEAKFKAGDFAGALVDFQAADAFKSTPQAQRYIGLCQDNLGHYPDAVGAYEKFLADVPAKLQKEGDEIKKRVETIKAMPGKVHVETVPAGASITVDGKPGANTPADLDLAPGKHTVHVELAGYLAMDKDVDVAYASKQDVKAELTAKPAEAPPPPPVVATTPTPPPPTTPAPPPEPPKQHSLVPGLVTGGLAVVAAGVGAVFGVMALGNKSDYDKNPTADKADSGENNALIADMSFGVAITLGVTSAVLLLSKDDDAAKPATSQVTHKKKAVTFTPTPIITPHGGGAGALIRF